MIPKLYLYGAAVIMFGVMVGAAYIKGRSDGHDIAYAQQAKNERIIAEAVAKATEAAAAEIAKIKVIHKTIQNEVQREVIEKPVYRDCRNDPAVYGLLNRALANSPGEPPGDGELPGADPAR
jgi:hypothetical protein